MWIEHPSTREHYEAKIRADFTWPSWDQAAAEIFDVVRAQRASREISAKSY
jgi:hypothetical protein